LPWAVRMHFEDRFRPRGHVRGVEVGVLVLLGP
jgi:hypothetical protein